jgi:hypothetical protein
MVRVESGIYNTINRARAHARYVWLYMSLFLQKKKQIVDVFIRWNNTLK